MSFVIRCALFETIKGKYFIYTPRDDVKPDDGEWTRFPIHAKQFATEAEAQSEIDAGNYFEEFEIVSLAKAYLDESAIKLPGWLQEKRKRLIRRLREIRQEKNQLRNELRATDALITNQEPVLTAAETKQ